MKKIIYRFIIGLILIVSFSIIYLSTIGIKTVKFNDLIVSEIRKVDPNLSLKINQVSVKLNPFSLVINLKTLGTDLIYKNKIIELENIKSQISLQSMINDKFALSEIMISTKSIPIKNLISLIRAMKNDPKLLIAEQFVENGYIVADLMFEFNEVGNIKKNFKINGLINNAQLSLLKNKITKLNFIFQITDKELNFEDVRLLINNKSLGIPELKAQKEKNKFFFAGRIKSKDLDFREDEIKELINNKFFKNNLYNITFDSDSKFTFNIDKKFKIKDLDINSVINIKKLKINNFLGKNSFLPKINNDIIFENQKIKLSYTKKKIDIIGSGNVFIQNNLDNINYQIINNEGNYLFDVNLKINQNPFIIDFINFEKDIKTNLDLKIEGTLKKNILGFDQISLSENKNILSIKNLKLSKDYKIEEIEKIKFDYKDNTKRKNKLEIKQDNMNYIIIGDSFNADKLITELLNSKKDSKKNLFNKNFNLRIDIQKVYLDQDNVINNLQGTMSLINNEITELNMESEFLNKQKITFSIKKNSGEKITTLFSNEAKPLVDRYKFIKGFSEGELDFYSIKKNNETKSTLKIYDFKLKELPVLTKVLTLASLQGIADLLSGEGIRFSEFEMNFTNNKDLMTIDEIYAIGPAISVLMEGYIEKDDLISLRGTLVPATTINKTISSIPLIGDILVGKKVGEGVFGVSFKIKGPPKDLETSVNPIKTLTPRFITRTLEKIKKD